MNTTSRRTPRAPRASSLALLPALALALGWAQAAPAQALGMQDMSLPPAVLPSSEPTVPTLWGSKTALQNRISLPNSSFHYGNVKSDVDGSLSSLASSPASLGDDRLSQLAKEAALLQAVGATPASGSFTTYRDAATAALTNIGTRTANSLTIAIPPCGGGSLDVLEDSPRLQSMAEAYDLLRGSGVGSTTDSSIRALIDNWASAFASDCNLTVLGSYPHKDNWGLKGGSALVTAALALSGDANASGWLSFANGLLSASIQNVGANSGWYREGAHYLNYALDDLFSSAVHVWNSSGCAAPTPAATCVDWLTPLKPFAQAALALRQPDGSEAPFEEGIPCVFPFDVFAPYYSDIGGQLAWAFNQVTFNFGAGNDKTDSYPLQQPVEATRFLAGELPTPVAPTGRVSQLVAGDAHIAALRSGWDANAVQGTLFAARDFENESGALIDSYHDMNNPLDLVVTAGGQTMLPTSGGGPEITESANRPYYLKASSKNVPLVNNGAPWITDGTKITSDLRLAGQDELGLTGRYLDMSRATTQTAYTQPVIAVARTLALIGGQYLAVVDELDSQAGQTPELNIPLHGRGVRGSFATTGSPLTASWSFMGEALDSFLVGSTAFTVAAVPGYYAATFSGSGGAGETSEETIEGLLYTGSASSTSSTVRAITLLAPRAATATPITVTDRTQANGQSGELPGLLAVKVQQGNTIDHIATAPEPYVLNTVNTVPDTDAGVLSDAGVEVTNIDGVNTDAVFSAVRESGNGVQAFGVGRATTLSFNGAPVFASGVAATVSFDESPALDGGSIAAGYIGELSPDTTGTSAFTVRNLAGYDPGVPYLATYQEQTIVAPHFIQLPDGFQFGGLTGGGTIAVAASGPEVLAAIPDHTVAEGQPLTFTLPFTAPTGVTLSFSFTSATTFPASAAPQLNASTGVFTWTPAFGTATPAAPAVVTVNFVASAPGFAVTRSAKITVTFVDRGPTLQPVPSGVVRRLTNFSVQLVATDPDGLPITYGYVPQQAFPSPAPVFDALHGTFSWNCPGTAPLGPNIITFTASDGQVTVQQSMTLQVEDVDVPPVFTTINGNPVDSPTMSTINTNVNDSLSLVFAVSNPEHNALTWTARAPRGTLPDGASFNPTSQTLAWTPNAAGSTVLIISATDNWGGTAQLQLTVNVSDSSGCTSGGAPGAFAMLFAILLVLRARRPRARAA